MNKYALAFLSWGALLIIAGAYTIGGYDAVGFVSLIFGIVCIAVAAIIFVTP